MSSPVLEPPAQLELDPSILQVPNMRAKGSLSPVLSIVDVCFVLIQSVFESPSRQTCVGFLFSTDYFSYGCTSATPAIRPSLVHVTTTNQPQNIHFLSTCYLPTLFGQFQSVSLLFRVGGWGWVEIIKIKANSVRLDQPTGT